MAEVSDRLAEVQGRIAGAAVRSGRTAEDVALVAVSKRQPEARVEAVYRAGHRLFGENYVDGLEARRARWPDVRLHMIGHLQKNKAARALAACDVIETVDNEKLARRLDRLADRVVPVLVQVMMVAEPNKAGVSPEALPPLLEVLRDLPKVEVRGLMCIPPPGDARRHFSALRALRDACRARTGLDLPELSMGMSADYEAAVEEGATLVRVGTALFGPRSP